MKKFFRGELVRLSNYKIAYPHNYVLKASFKKVTVRNIFTNEVQTFPYARLLSVVEKRNQWIKGN